MRREPNATYRLKTFDLLRYTTIICYTLAGTLAGFAKPRPPVPPLPERQLWDWHFDDANWIYKPTSNAVIAQNLALAESWSGYALDMSGNQPSALVLPMLSGRPKPYLAANAGTIRFWFSPNWGSASSGGAGPGGWARLFEVGNPVDALEQFWITLAIDPTGNILTLAGTCAGCPPFYLQAGSLQWQQNGWHEIAIVYSPTNTMLVVDGGAVASTANGLPWPLSSEWPHLAFAFGSGLDGQDIARGQLEELTTFSFPVSLEYLAWHYQQFAPVAALGPIADEAVAKSRAGITTEMTASDSPPIPDRAVVVAAQTHLHTFLRPRRDSS